VVEGTLQIFSHDQGYVCGFLQPVLLAGLGYLAAAFIDAAQQTDSQLSVAGTKGGIFEEVCGKIGKGRFQNGQIPLIGGDPVFRFKDTV